MEQIVRINQIQEDGCAGVCPQGHGSNVAMTEDKAYGVHSREKAVAESEALFINKAVSMVYILPLALFVVCYLLGQQLWQKGAMMSVLGALIGMVLVKIYHSHLEEEDRADSDFSENLSAESER